jgi:Tol biopolymer transport system component
MMQLQKSFIALDRLDRVMVVAIGLLLAAIGAVIVRGDQVGIAVQSYSPINKASSRASIQVAFDETLVSASVESNFKLIPPVQGRLFVSQNQVTFRPTEPLTQGQEYTVTLKAGVQSSTGRLLKNDVQWRFRVAPPRVVYLGPVDSIVQNLYLADPSEKQAPQPLTTSKEGVIGYDVSPDGSSIVYAQLEAHGPANLYVWDTASATSRLLYECKDAACSGPVWRPDGGAVAFEKVELNSGTGMPPGAPRVWVYDVASNTAKPLFSDNQQLGFMPRWSPDGRRLAVFNVNAGGIVIHDFTSGQDSVIPTVGNEVGAFSPDGKWLYFPKVVSITNSQYATHLVLVDVSAQPYVQHDLIPDSDPSDDVEAAWLPDSKAMIVARRLPHAQGTAPTQLYVIDIASQKATPLVVDPAYSQSNMSVNPTGDTVLFQRFPLGKSGARPELWTVNLKTKALQMVAPDGSAPGWLP